MKKMVILTCLMMVGVCSFAQEAQQLYFSPNAEVAGKQAQQKEKQERTQMWLQTYAIFPYGNISSEMWKYERKLQAEKQRREQEKIWIPARDASPHGGIMGEIQKYEQNQAQEGARLEREKRYSRSHGEMLRKMTKYQLKLKEERENLVQENRYSRPHGEMLKKMTEYELKLQQEMLRQRRENQLKKLYGGQKYKQEWEKIFPVVFGSRAQAKTPIQKQTASGFTTGHDNQLAKESTQITNEEK